jgi:superfamily II DNA or RNA helicase
LTGKDLLLQEGLSALQKANYEGIILLPTGVGKGRLMVEAAKLLNPKSILYLCESTVSRDVTFKDELRKWDAAYLLARTDFVCYQTARKWVGKSYDLLLADEFDASLTPKYKKVYANNSFKNRILVSATLDPAKRVLAEKLGTIIFERKPQEVIDAKVVNGIKFYFVNYNLTPDENATYLSYNLQFKKLLNEPKSAVNDKKLGWLKITRKQFMSKLGSSLEVAKWLIHNIQKARPHEKILVFTGLSEQANKVSKNAYHSLNGEDHLLDDFHTGKIKLLAVVDKVNRAVNINQIRHIIHESVGSSKTKLTQRTGRGQRLDVDEVLSVYFLVPHFISMWGERKPTIVLQWILDAAEDMDLTKCKTINYVNK